MITGFFLQIFFTFLNFVFGLLSGAVLATGATGAFSGLVNYVYQYNSILPIDTALQVLSWTVDFWILVFTFDFLKWLIHLIRGN